MGLWCWWCLGSCRLWRFAGSLEVSFVVGCCGIASVSIFCLLVLVVVNWLVACYIFVALVWVLCWWACSVLSGLMMWR